MKRLLCLLLAVLMLGACAASPADTQPTTAPIGTAAPTTEATEEATEPQWAPFTGKLNGYVYYYDQGRSRDWEEDILHVAGVFLGEVYANGHPLLTDMEFQTMFSMDGMDVEYRYF